MAGSAGGGAPAEAAAAEGEIVTALDYPLDDLSVRVVGRCVVHTAAFRDVGLVW